MSDPCPNCRLNLEREDGSFLGALALNYGVTALAFLVVLGVGTALTVPDVPVVGLLAISAVVTVLTPILFYPTSKTVWASLEYLAHRVDR